LEQLGSLTVTLLPQALPPGHAQRAAPSGMPASQPQGAFRGLLLQALLGGQPGRGEARMPLAPVAVVPPGLGQQAPEPAQTGEGGQPEAPTAQTSEQVIAALVKLMEEHGLQNLPVSLRNLLQVSAPAPDPSGPPAPPDPAQAAQALAAFVLQLLQAGSAQVPAQSPDTAEAAPPAPVVAQGSAPQLSDPQLERFVQAVTRLAEAGGNDGPAPDQEPGAVSQGKTFQDLIRLIAGGETEAAAGTEKPPSEAQPQAAAVARDETKAESKVEIKALLKSDSKADSQSGPKAEAKSAPKIEARQDPAPQAPAKSMQLEQPTDPAPVPDRPRVDADQVIRQTARFLKVTLEGQRSEVRFQLQPEHLGTVAVKLVLNEGVVKASMTAADPAVKAVLEANLEQLRSRLSDQGFRVEQIQVTVGGSSASGQQAQQGHQGQSQQGTSREGWQQGQHEQDRHPSDGEPAPQRPAARTWVPGRKGARMDSFA
jgi:flagellar hook-length control protein FliK